MSASNGLCKSNFYLKLLIKFGLTISIKIMWKLIVQKIIIP